MTITAVCVRVHVSDNMGTLCKTVNSWLAVDAVLRDDVSDNREWLWGDKSYLHACSHER